MPHKNTVGKRGEQLAADFLTQRGYRILQQNYYTHWGEIDIVAQESDRQVIIFIEVKTRTSKRFGNPEEAFDQRKQQRFSRSMYAYLRKHHALHRRYRADMIAVELTDQQKALIRHYKNVSLNEV